MLDQFKILRIHSRVSLDVNVWKQCCSLDVNVWKQCCQLSRIIRETPDFGPYLPVSRLESDIGDTSNSDHNLNNRTALLGHEAEEHYHSLDNVTTLSAEKGEDLVDYMKNKYGEGNVSEEICPKCCKKFKCLSAGIYEDESGMMQYYADVCYACDVCSKEEE